MKNLDMYIEHVAADDKSREEALRDNVKEFKKNVLDKFTLNGVETALFLGHVQSGKTSEVISALSLCADEGYKSFIVLTSGNVMLQKQTYTRFKESLIDIDVYDEHEISDFQRNGLRSASVIVLKKNSKKLESWIDTLKSVEAFATSPLVLFDDEADAESLNTKVNEEDTSTINRLLLEIVKIPSSTLFVQVTATPYANLLQSDDSLSKPTLFHLFEPGESYLGGDYFYDPNSGTNINLNDGELDEFLEETNCPRGLAKSIFYYIHCCMYIDKFKSKRVNNFLIHPGISKDSHKLAKKYVQEVFDLSEKNMNLWADYFKEEFEEVQNIFSQYFTMTMEEFGYYCWKTRVRIKNSDEDIDANDLKRGFNVVIGGNSLGRGITIPALNTVYYIRNSNTPQHDTVWQHSRIFGYDRDKDICKTFIPDSLFTIFSELSQAHYSLFRTVRNNGLEGLTIMSPTGTRPTRRNVLDNEAINFIIGGVQYFLKDVNDIRTAEIDSKILELSKDDEFTIDITKLNELLKLFEINRSNFQLLQRWMFSLKLLKEKMGDTEVKVYIRKDRDIKSDYRSVLSANDNKLIRKNTESISIFLYRLKCTKSKGWSGGPRWVPVIQFPERDIFYTNLNQG
ncbi:Z1 domain-containing protein [Halobacteriovorax sp. DPLXC-1]|uniref:Z1 domain-containing protein n=1 Tax=Halobacteriovorax sp. DPLXC-1 TaxID=3110771 RepID=UPI002FEFAAB5